MSEIKVVIKWTRLKKWGDVFDLDDDEKDSGIYMINGHHPVFGDDALLYIGQTKKQTFCERFVQHEEWLKNEWNKTIYVGRVISIDDEDEKIYHGNRWHAVIKNSEAMMIYFHSPPYNSKNISNPPRYSKKLRIINIGDCGDLYPEISHEALQLEKLSPRPSDV